MCRIWPLCFCCRHVNNMSLKPAALARTKTHFKQCMRGGSCKNIIVLPLEKWTLRPTLPIKFVIITWYFPLREICRAHIRLSFKPAGWDSVCCLKTHQQRGSGLDPKLSGWTIISCYQSNAQENSHHDHKLTHNAATEATHVRADGDITQDLLWTCFRIHEDLTTGHISPGKWKIRLMIMSIIHENSLQCAILRCFSFDRSAYTYIEAGSPRTWSQHYCNILTT